MPDANAINIVVSDQGYQSDGRGPGPKTKEQKELDRLRSENEALKKERDQLAAKCAVMAESLWERSGDCELQGLPARAKALLECADCLRAVSCVLANCDSVKPGATLHDRIDKALAGLEVPSTLPYIDAQDGACE